MCSWIRELKSIILQLFCSVLIPIITPVFMLSIVHESVVRALSIVYVVACELFQLQHD